MMVMRMVMMTMKIAAVVQKNHQIKMTMRRFEYGDVRFGGQAYGTGYREMSDSR